MNAEYDFSQSRKNPYLQYLPKRDITIQLEAETISYFQDVAQDTGMPFSMMKPVIRFF